MKNTWLIILLLLTTRLHAQYQKVGHTPFSGLSQEAEELFSDRYETNEDLFTICIEPLAQQLTIEITSDSVKFSGKYTIYNIFGRQILHGQITEKTTALSVAGLSKGIYLLNVTLDKKQQTKKFLVR